MGRRGSCREGENGNRVRGRNDISEGEDEWDSDDDGDGSNGGCELMRKTSRGGPVGKWDKQAPAKDSEGFGRNVASEGEDMLSDIESVMWRSDDEAEGDDLKGSKSGIYSNKAKRYSDYESDDDDFEDENGFIEEEKENRIGMMSKNRNLKGHGKTKSGNRDFGLEAYGTSDSEGDEGFKYDYRSSSEED